MDAVIDTQCHIVLEHALLHLDQGLSSSVQSMQGFRRVLKRSSEALLQPPRMVFLRLLIGVSASRTCCAVGSCEAVESIVGCLV